MSWRLQLYRTGIATQHRTGPMKNSSKLLRRSLRDNARGFTLLELIVVVAIAAILAGTGVPSMTSLVRSAKLTSATNDLFGSFMMARSEAVKRQSRVVVCKSSNGVTCASAGGWEQGWIVFHDPNNNGARESSEHVVQYAQALSSDLHLSGNLNVSRYVSYSASGTAKLSSGAFQAGTITLCNVSRSASEARQIILNSSGRPRVQKTKVPSCA